MMSDKEVISFTSNYEKMVKFMEVINADREAKERMKELLHFTGSRFNNYGRKYRQVSNKEIGNKSYTNG